MSVIIASLNPAVAEINVSDVLTFEVIDAGTMRSPGLSGKWFGVVRTPLKWHTQLVESLQHIDE